MKLPVATVDAVVARIAAAHGALPAGAIAFDGDGTLWSGDIGEDFFHATVAAGRFLPPAVSAMIEVGRALGVDTGGGNGAEVAKRLFAGYIDGRVPEDTICEVIAWVCAGWTRDDVYAFAREVVSDGGLAARMHTELHGVLEWAKREKVPALLVSASPRPVVEVAGALLGFEPASILASTAPFAHGVMLPQADRPIPYGPGKATLLAEHLQGAPLLAAFGDNVFDIPMLRAARVAVAVEPKPRLLAALSREGAGQGAGEESEPGFGLVRLAMGP